MADEGKYPFLDLVLLNIGYSEPNEGWNWKNIYSPFARIYYVTQGRAHTRINGTEYTLVPGYLYLTPPFTLHEDESQGEFSLYYIHFYENPVNRESVFDRYLFPVAVEANNLHLSLIERLLCVNPNRELRYIDPQIYDNQLNFSRYVADNSGMSLHSVVETQSILSLLMTRFIEYRKPKMGDTDIRISKSLQYIHENTNNTISISELAQMSHISRDYYIRLFRKEINLTPTQYIISKKMEKAELLLLSTSLPIKDIALELAFDNISYFNRLFKKATGQTPNEYRYNNMNQLQK